MLSFILFLSVTGTTTTMLVPQPEPPLHGPPGGYVGEMECCPIFLLLLFNDAFLLLLLFNGAPFSCSSSVAPPSSCSCSVVVYQMRRGFVGGAPNSD